MKLNRRHVFLAVGALGLTGFVGGAWAVIAPGSAAFPAADGTFHACVDTTSRRIRMVDPTSPSHRDECRADEVLISWNQIGPAGPAGVAGAPGPAGPAGTDGAPGSAGADGAAGPMGPAGPMGFDGAPGPAGLDGAPGLAGAAGPAGPMGPMGPMGLAGPAGADGAVGARGPAGADGAAGPAGPTGVDGAPGVQGPAGPQGIAGVADGAQVILNGNAAQTGDFNITGTGTMASAVINGGQLRLGDQDLTAAALQTLVAGGNADALHTHAGAANPWVQVTAWNSNVAQIQAAIVQYPFVAYEWGAYASGALTVDPSNGFLITHPDISRIVFGSFPGVGFSMKTEDFVYFTETNLGGQVQNDLVVAFRTWGYSLQSTDPDIVTCRNEGDMLRTDWIRKADGTIERGYQTCTNADLYVRRR